MQSGVYRKVKASGRGKGGGIGELYQFLHIERDHYDGHERIAYIPLRIEPEWAGTVRVCSIIREDFERMFEWVGEGLPASQEKI